VSQFLVCKKLVSWQHNTPGITFGYPDVACYWLQVELDEITVRQEIVEVALDPSMLLYVNNSKPGTININQQSSASSQRIIIAE
jgi:hypothetical protein